MGRSAIPPALVELANPTSPEAQVEALRNLKNEIVGHEQRKELAVVYGVVKPLAGLLRTETRKGGKRRRGVANGNGNANVNAGLGRDSERSVDWTIEDELRFQATLVIGSLANGGPAFITPLLAGDVLPPLLEALNPNETPSKLLVTTLRTLNQIVDAVAQEKPSWDSSSVLSQAVNQHLYTKSVIENLAEIIAQSSRSRTVYLQISSAAQIIIKTCREESQKKMLLEAGVLDLLAAKMAAIAAADDPSRKPETRSPSIEAQPKDFLADILEAISTIIRGSHFNTARFVYSQHVQSVFGRSKGASATYDAYSGSSQSSSWDKLIPRLRTLQSKTDPYSKAWPALGSFSTSHQDKYSRFSGADAIPQPSGRSVISDEAETPLFIWLMFAARRAEGRERLAACWLLALLKEFGERWSLNDPSRIARERHFSFLIVPLVVKLIEETNPTTRHAKSVSLLHPTNREEFNFVTERAPLVLAELIAGNKALQTAAVDAKILPLIVQLMKKSFDPVTTSAKPLWHPKSTAPPNRDPMVDDASSTLGRPGLGFDLVHAYKYRENALLALAAIADTQDVFRKLVIEMGAAPVIIDSLVPLRNELGDSSSETSPSTTPKEGNPDAVLIAACKTLRSISRSISVLRTSLIDYGVAQPVFDLLTHPNVKVQIAATEVITNLVLEVSPMRTEIIGAGAIKTLCEHCHSANFDLRCGSLWALKHLCLGIPHSMKIQCLEELGIGWLMQVLNGDPSSKPAPLGMGTPNAAGEQVDILNAMDDPHMDIDDEESSSEDEETMNDNISSLLRRQRPAHRYTSATNLRERIQQIKSEEYDKRLSSERDDIRIQEQALDFVRNFITEEHAAADNLIDHLLNSFGHSSFFELLDSKLRPKTSSSHSTNAPPNPSNTTTAPNYRTPTSTSTSRLPPFSSLASNAPSAAGTSPSQQTAQSQPNWSSYPATDLIVATLYILMHLASGRPAQRSLLISQTALMSHVLPLTGHPRREVRLPCVWLIHNLIWIEDATDEAAARERAAQLHALGFDEGVRVLGRDVDLDIRERAKVVVEQMWKLLGASAGASVGVQSTSSGGSGGFAGEASSASASAMPGFRGLGGGMEFPRSRWGRE